MKLVVLSEIPVSYRQGWFDYVASHSELELVVMYLAGGQGDRTWESGISSGHRSLQLKSKSLAGTSEGFFARATPGLERSLTKEAPDFVVIPGWAHPSCWQAVRWCRRTSTPYGVTLENWKTQRATLVPSPVTSVPRRQVLAHSAVALAAGSQSADYAETLTDRPVRLLHANVADVDAADRSESTFRSGRPTVLYLGRLMAHKGIDYVLEMASSLGADGISTVVAGDGPERTSVEKAAAAGLVDYVGIVAGEAKFRLMASADVVVMPSREEPWGVVLQEALASGTPVVASSEVGSAFDFLTPATGAVVPLDRGAIELAIRSWLRPSEANRFACRAAARRVNYSTVTNQLESVVHEFAA